MSIPLESGVDPSKRALMVAGFAVLAASLSRPTWAATHERFAQDFWVRPRQLSLRHVSGERIQSTYWSDGELIVSEYTRLSYFMRDRVVGRGVYVNPVVLDILYGINGWLAYFGVTSPVVVTSAYRDPVRNLQIEGAARTSKHTSGDAVDITIPNVSPLQVARFGMWLGGGGVGWYPEKQFTHLDRGRLRSWRG